MELLSEIETAAAGKFTVILANVSEANILLDKVPHTEYPVMIILPYTILDRREASGLWVGTVDFNCMFLDRDPMATTLDYDTKRIEQEFTAPLRMKAKSVFNKLNLSDIIFQKRPITGVNYVPTYGEMDEHLHGVIARCTMEIVETNPGCES